MPTNTSTVTMLTVAARLLAEHADAPAICSVHTGVYYNEDHLAYRPEVTLQLAAVVPAEELRDAALWARRLDSAVAFSTYKDNVRVAATGEIDGVRVEVWTYVPPDSLTAVLPSELADHCLPAATVAPVDLLVALS